MPTNTGLRLEHELLRHARFIWRALDIADQDVVMEKYEAGIRPSDGDLPLNCCPFRID